MSTHDTDPQRSLPFSGPQDATEPGPPPEVAEVTDGNGHARTSDAQLAASLLADLAKAPLPTEGVRETEGHAAASVAVALHRPPRAVDDAAPEPAVLVNTTEPLPRPAVVAAAAAPPLASNGVEARRSAAQQYSTVPSARVHRRQTIAVAIVIAIAAVAAGLIVAFAGGDAAPSAVSAPVLAPVAPMAPASAAAAMPAPSSAVMTSASSGPPTPAPPLVVHAASTTQAPAAPVAPATTRAPATVSATTPAPHTSASAPRAPHPPSGSFAEPDRNF